MLRSVGAPIDLSMGAFVCAEGSSVELTLSTELRFDTKHHWVMLQPFPDTFLIRNTFQTPSAHETVASLNLHLDGVEYHVE